MRERSEGSRQVPRRARSGRGWVTGASGGLVSARRRSWAAALLAGTMAGLLAGCGGGGGGPGHGEPPVIRTVRADPQEVAPEGVVTLTCQADDPDGEALIYEWSVREGQGIFTDGYETPQVMWQAPPVRSTCTLVVLVRDGVHVVAGETQVHVREDAPVLAVDPDALNFGEESAAQMVSSLALEVRNLGGSPLSWEASADSSWASVSPSEGLSSSRPDTITVTVDRTGLPSGYRGTRVNVFSNGGTARIPVAVWIRPEAALGVSPASLDFGTSRDPMPLVLSNGGTGTLVWQAYPADADSSWIDVSPVSGAMGAGGTATLQVTVSTIGRTPGEILVGALWLDSNGGSATVAIRAEVP